MNFRKTLVLVFGTFGLLATISACDLPFISNQHLQSPELKAALTAKSIPYSNLEQGADGTPDGPIFTTFRSQQEVDDFLKAHPLIKAGNSLPNVDFSTHLAIFAQLAPQSTGQIKMEIVSIEEQDDQLLVHSVRWLPPEGTPTTQLSTWPYHYVSIQRTSKPIAFSPVVSAPLNQRPNDTTH
ncbi:hypothetical protein J7643_10950 [bacterium]|nr:hypothetical protein [bacterium]